MQPGITDILVKNYINLKKSDGANFLGRFGTHFLPYMGQKSGMVESCFMYLVKQPPYDSEPLVHKNLRLVWEGD